MTKRIITGLFLPAFTLLSAYAQTHTTTSLPDRSCDCRAAFDDLVSKVETNYLGYKQMVARGEQMSYLDTKIAYGRLTENLPAEACTRELQRFLDQFEDGHLFVYERPEYSDREQALLEARAENSRKSLAYIRERVDAGDPTGPVGRWTDGNYRIHIIKEGDAFNAYTVIASDSLPAGTLLASLKETSDGYEGFLNNYDLEPRYVQAGLYKEQTLLHLGGATYWGRLDDGPDRELKMIDPKNVLAPILTWLDEETTLFSIPSFLVDPAIMRDLLLSNLEGLTKRRNLIIDIRGNTGGNALYFMFTDIYVTKDLPRSQGKVLASEATLRYYERMAGNSSSPIYPPLIKRIRDNMGEIVDGPEYQGRKAKSYPSSIEKVAILTDEACKSAAESFILHSKAMSDKVTTFGRPTGGVIDFTSINQLSIDSGNQHIVFGYPTSSLGEAYYTKEYKDGYNKQGIRPDVAIPDSVRDKVAFVKKHL